MFVEIGICTWNRASLLEETLTSLLEIEVPVDIRWQVLLVDNCSTDTTQEVIKQFETRLPLQALFEETQGHTHARNQIVDAATGDLLIWTDDDCRFNPRWMSRYVEAARNRRFDFWGGAIEPHFINERPSWIAENWEILKGCYAQRDLGETPIEFTRELLPYGANFAVRTAVQKEHRFDVDLGRKAHQVFGEDEIEFMKRLLDHGCSGKWVPSNPIQHLIPPERATPKYVYDYYVGQGRKVASNRSSTSESRLNLHVSSRWNWLMYKLKQPRVASNIWVSHLLQSALAKGRLIGSDAR